MTLDVADYFLHAARLTKEPFEERLNSLPPEGRRERDLLLAIRQGISEDVNELDVTRDLLHSTAWIRLWYESQPPPYPPWIRPARDEQSVQVQYEAAQELLKRLVATKSA